MAQPEIWFWIAATVLTLFALWVVLRPLLSKREIATPDQIESNAAIYRGQLDDLERDLAAGTLDAEHYAESRRELERRLLDEASPSAAPRPSAARRWRFALLVAALLPLTALGLYYQLGSRDAISYAPLDNLMAQAKPEGHAKDADLDPLVARLAARLRDKTPEDGEGWALLARSYVELKRHAEASAAFAKAAALLPRDPVLLVDYADALAMAQGRRMEGKPAQLVEQALALDPRNEKALMLAATHEFDRHRYPEAIKYWERLSHVAPPGSESAKEALASIEESKAIISGKAVAAAPAAPVEAPAQAMAAPRAASAAEIRGEVTLAPALASRVKPTDTLFIFARAATGSRMPVAILTAKAGALPYRFTLSDSMNLMPGRNLSKMESVVVVARITSSGQATVQSGDLEGATPPLRPGGQPVKLVIERVTP
ncbi:MAG: c-type cytochrome biogenesis protein CcmI [Hydrogenophilales bacterium]|nr:c-type cytochrome biogenesis protein CcmI [Hydrogenophilales bacterium]